ncbi:MAG: hypothetical protein ACKPGT_12915 [Microcystis sp.]
MMKKVVPVEIREMLLKELGVCPGEAVIRRQRSRDGDRILVVAYPGSPLTESDIPDKYHGYAVRFERHSVPQAGS